MTVTFQEKIESSPSRKIRILISSENGSHMAQTSFLWNSRLPASFIFVQFHESFDRMIEFHWRIRAFLQNSWEPLLFRNVPKFDSWTPGRAVSEFEELA